MEFAGGSMDLSFDEQTGTASLLINHPDRKNAFTGKSVILCDNLDPYFRANHIVYTLTRKFSYTDFGYGTSIAFNPYKNYFPRC